MRFSRVVFLGFDLVRRLHDRVIVQTGGMPGIRDQGLLESAVARPMQSFGDELLFPTLASMAAALTVGIIQNHPFLDGNKRTGIAAGMAFLRANEYALAENQGYWIDVVTDVVCRRRTESELAEAFAKEMGSDCQVELDE